MSEMILCPVCETENEPAATHCEVCGERLAPAAPGEVLSPEESVAATLQPGTSVEDFDLGMPELPVSEADDRPSFASTDSDGDEYPGDLDDSPMASPAASEAKRPADVLYSSLDGTPFERGTPEFEDGFGPMGEELVDAPPSVVRTLDDSRVHADKDPTVDEDGFRGGGDVYPPSSNQRASAAFSAAFPLRHKERPVPQPLPQPGVHSTPATLTLYVNRQPVHTHAIETDETLIGRRDPMADSYPDVDLTQWDEGAHISRKHVYIYRQNRNYQLYVVSNAGTQLNADLLTLGERRPLKSGDVLVLAGKFAMKFELPAE